MNITKSEDQARYIADQALQAQAAGDLAAAELLLQQAQAIDPDVALNTPMPMKPVAPTD